MTEWRTVPDWPAYEVSDEGGVRRGGRQLKPWRLKNGRWQLRLCDGSRAKAFHTYRLVALAFLGPPPFEGAVVAHKDDNLDDNRASNLKWCTQRENCADRNLNGRGAYGSRNGAHTKPHRVRRGEDNGHAKLTEDCVRFIRTSPRGQTALAAAYGVSMTTIKDVRSRKTWRHI